jgi:hypothetical protein
MNRIELVKKVAEKYGTSLAEYLILHVATAFAMTAQEASGFLVKMLAHSNYASVNCDEAIEACVQKGWVSVSREKRLVLTAEGRALAHKIGGELTQPEGEMTKAS